MKSSKEHPDKHLIDVLKIQFPAYSKSLAHDTIKHNLAMVLKAAIKKDEEAHRLFCKEVTDEEIDAEAEKYGFRVPYDGSNNFYDKLAIKGFTDGAKWMREKMTGK